MIPGRQFAARQIKGARDYQEDDYGYFSALDEKDHRPHDLLMVMADGMGGHNGGAHASGLAVGKFIETFTSHQGKVSERLAKGLEVSNGSIRVASKKDPDLQGMGCTLVGVFFNLDGLEWISVGDSPLWLYRDGNLVQINEDHSMAPIIAEQIESGDLTPEEGALHPHRNALRSALVGEDIPLIDASQSPLVFDDGDKIVLASDGLQTLTDDEIADIVSADEDAHGLAEQLIEAVDAKQRRGQDNTTVMVVTPFTKAERRPSMSWIDK